MSEAAVLSFRHTVVLNIFGNTGGRVLILVKVHFLLNSLAGPFSIALLISS